MAQLEQQRSNILELISSSEPLPDVLRAITATVSARLDGAPCWFELIGLQVETAGHERTLLDERNVVSQNLTAHDGACIGRLVAAPSGFTPQDADVGAALRIGVRLAELAIDTRRLLSDLRHRSEHDLLTGIPNRFSMERQLEEMIIKASRELIIFGLIYVDLDLFKEINDKYGHRTGDLYLQAVTKRMKAQLRNGDMLARIGGDEFIALTPVLHSRVDAEEIVSRLEHCFDAPFEIEGNWIHGSASVGLALYPEDGVSKEDLQRHADAAMYAHKEEKLHRSVLGKNRSALSRR